MAVVLEPVVNAEKLAALLDEQCESEQLDYKDIEDLNENRSRVEIAKDVAAMMASGGYLVIGVDGRGKPTGNMTNDLAKLFDEAKLRPILRQYLAPPIQIVTAEHEVDSKVVVVVYVAPHPEGFAIINSIGQYDVNIGVKTKLKIIFSPGDVFVRNGTSSERWAQGDLPRLLRRRDERIREETRTELAKTLAAMQQGQEGQQIAAGPAAAFNWQLDEAAFDATAIELIRRNDRVPLRLTLLRITGDAADAIRNKDSVQLMTIMDRLSSLTAVAITLGDTSVRDDAIKALRGIYQLGFTVSGERRCDLGVSTAWMWREVVARVEALGALAVRLADWGSVRALTLQRSHDTDGYFASWLRHGLTAASRENPIPSVSGEMETGRRSRAS